MIERLTTSSYLSKRLIYKIPFRGSDFGPRRLTLSRQIQVKARLMETDDEPPVASGNIATPRAGSIVKDRKKKLKAVFRKRHHGLGNLSIRNSTLNSTIFKTSLKINNRALAQALERKKSECRAAEAIILKQKEELQLMTADVNKVKMFAERTKRLIQERLRAVSATMHLAVDQLAEAMDACTDGEFRKMSGPLLPLAASTSVLPSVNEQLSLQPPVSNVVVRPVAGPSRVIVSAAAATCDDDDDDDEDQDVVASMNPTKAPAPCDDGPSLPAVAAASDLSIIMEQSYMVPSETDLPYDEPGFGYRRTSSRDRRNAIVFQPSGADSPAPPEDESSEEGVCVRRMVRSRSRKSFGLPIHAEMNMLQDAGIARSKSRDRRNAMIFHPSVESPDADRDSAGKCVRILRRSRNPSGQFPEAPSSAVKTHQGLEDAQGSGESSKIKESVAMAAEVDDDSGGEDVEQLYLDETLLVETEVFSSKMVGQLSRLQNLVENGKVSEGNSAIERSMELVDETIIASSEQSSCVSETVMETDLSQLSCEEGKELHTSKASVEVHKHPEQVSKSLTVSKVSRAVQQKSGYSDLAVAEEADDLVKRGQFVTKDKIARTPVKVRRFRDGAEGSVEECEAVRQSIDYLSDISDRESIESEYRRSRSLSRRDIPTFLPIDSPNASGTAPGTSKRTVSATTKGQAKSSKFLKLKGTKKDGAGPADLKDGKRQNKPGLVSYQDADAKGDVVYGAGLSKKNAGGSRRGTFALPNGGIRFLEADIMLEDDSVLINESFESCPETGDDVFVDADPLPGDEGRGTRSNRVVSEHVEQLSNVPSLSALAEKNVTILMAEDMEQTGVSFTAITISDPPAGVVRQLPDSEVNDVGESCPNGKVQGGNLHSPEKQPVGSDELALHEKKSKLLLPASCSESVRAKTTGKICKDKDRETMHRNEMEARDEGGESDDVKQTSNAVKRRRVAHSRLKLPGSGAATLGTSGEKDAKSPPRVAATKRGTVFDDTAQSLANVNRKKTETESESEENPEQSMDVDVKKRCAAYLSKPGNIVFNADRRDVIGSEVAKKSRSKTRSILPLQQKPRSKATATSSSTSCAKPEVDGTSSSVWDFKGTPRLALAKENADRLLSVYDISLNDSGVIPKPKDEASAVPSHCLKKRSKAPNEFSKDDSFIVDKKPLAGKRRVRHESTGAIDCLATFASESESVPRAALESPHGIMLVLGNGKRRKPPARSKTVRYDVTKPEMIVPTKEDNDKGKTNGFLPDVNKDAAVDQLALEKISSATESDVVPKLKPAGFETVVTVEDPKERSAQQSSQLGVNCDKLVADLAKDAEEEAESISVRDVRLECAKSKGLSHSTKDVKNPESQHSKEVTHRTRTGGGTASSTENIVAANDEIAAANVKGSDAGKKGQSSGSAKGRGVANPRKETTTKDGTNSKKGSKNADSKGSSNFFPLFNSNTASSDTVSSQSVKNLGHDDDNDDDDNTVLYANREQTSASDRASKTDLPDSASLPDSLKPREPDELEQVTSEQEPVSSHAGNTEQPNDTESPQQVAVQRRVRKRRVIQSTDLFEDIDTQSLHSPKPKQPALAKDDKQPVTLAGVTKALLKPDNHRKVDSPTARHSQSELTKLHGAGNARRDHNSLRLRKNLKSAKAPESSNVPEVSGSNGQFVSDPPFGAAEKTSDSKRKSSEKDLLAVVPPRRRTNLSIKNSKEEKTSQRKSSLPKEERVPVSADALQRNLVGARKGLVLQDDGGSEDKSKKKRSAIRNRQSSISTGSCDTSTHSEMAERRTRRNAAQAVSYKEPSLGKKLRRGDPHTSTIYGGANPELEKLHGSERTSDARLSRKVLSSVQNTSMESME